MTATRPARCGCAFSSEGRPWVAHRVCPTPHVPESGSFVIRSVRRAIFPWDLRMAIPPPDWTATPAESYPRYSSRRRPSTRISTQELGPVYPTMPHMSLLSLLRLGGGEPRFFEKLRPLAGDPPLDRLLFRPAQRQRVGGYVHGDRRSRADQGSLAHRDRRDQHRVAPDEDPVPDHRGVLVDAVVVAGDRPRAHVDLLPDGGVPEIGKMVRLGSLSDPALLHLDEVPDVRSLAD